MFLNNKINEVIVDGETFLNSWTGLQKMTNTRIFLSASNYLYARILYAKTLEILLDKEQQLDEYTNEHSLVIKILQNEDISKCFDEFLKSEDTYMCNIDVVPSNNLYLTIYKGFMLNKEEDVDIAPFLEEAIAYALENRDAQFVSMSEEIFYLNEEFELGLNIVDLRHD